MSILKTDSWRNEDRAEHQVEKEEEFARVRCRKDTPEEESLGELAGEKVWRIPRRWHIY